MAIQGISDKDPALRAIHVSIQYDRRLWQEDLDGSRAHVAMLGACDILSDEEVTSIQGGLDAIEQEIREERFPFREDFEDIHLNIEQRLIELIGPVGGKLHTGRSRNDQVALDLRLWTLRQGQHLRSGLRGIVNALLEQAESALEDGVVLPFYTHLQRAQPVLLAHHFLAHAEALERDDGRLRDALDRTRESPLGAGAGAGAGFAIDPTQTAEALGFERPCRNSLDAVAARDFALELLSALSIHMVHLSRMAEEIILWSSQEFRFAVLSNKVTTGSSIMPQKRNPDGAELVRAKAGRVFGGLAGLLATIKALPLAYNKDLQEDKEALFDAVDAVRLCQAVLAATVREARFDGARMRSAVTAREGYANATELADYLARKGMPFRQAHAVVKELVDQARTRGRALEELSLKEFKAAAELIEDDVFEALGVEAALERRSALMGTGPARVREALTAARMRWGEG